MPAEQQAINPALLEAEDERPVDSKVNLQIVDDPNLFLPLLEETFDKRHSTELVEMAQASRYELEYELKLVQKKKSLLPKVREILDMDLLQSSLDFPRASEFDIQIRKIVEAYESTTPYKAVSELIVKEPYKSLTETQYDFETFPDLAVSMKTSAKVRAIFRKHTREGHERKVESAHERAREIAIFMLQKIFFKIAEIQEQLSREMRDQGEKVKYDSLEKFYQCDYDSLEGVLDRLKVAVKRHKQLIAQAKHLGELTRVIEKYKGVCNQELEWYVSRASNENSELRAITDDSIKLTESNESNMNEGKIWSRIFECWRRLNLKFFTLDQNAGVYDLNNNSFHATREFYEIVREINLLIDKICRSVGPGRDESIKPLEFLNHLASLGKEIYKSAILTHTTQTRRMYDILEDGELKSYRAQKSTGGKNARTHGGNSNDEILETHSICFEPHYLYRSFSSEPNTMQHDAQIALIFDENQLLSKGRQFVPDMDGLHVYDPGFNGDNEYSPGLHIDLMNTPNMIVVTNREKERFLAFLVEKSAWKDVLSKMSNDEFEEWLDQNVIFTDSIGEFLPKARDRFNKSKKVPQNRGYVVPTGKFSNMKGGLIPTMRFVPQG